MSNNIGASNKRVGDLIDDALEKRLIILMDLHKVLFPELREGAPAP